MLAFIEPTGARGEASDVWLQTTPTVATPAYSDLTPEEKARRAAVPLEVVAQWALQFTNMNFPVASGTPEVRLVRPVRASELAALGLPVVSQVDGEPPLVLVILHGDFDLNRGIGTGGYRGYRAEPSRAQYVGLLYDVWNGLPTWYGTSFTGGRFRLALNDPSLPEEPAAPDYNPDLARTPIRPPDPPGGTQIAGEDTPAPPTPQVLAPSTPTREDPFTPQPSDLAFGPAPTAVVPVGRAQAEVDPPNAADVAIVRRAID